MLNRHRLALALAHGSSPFRHVPHVQEIPSGCKAEVNLSDMIGAGCRLFATPDEILLLSLL